MKRLTQTLTDKYYRFKPGEFLPIYVEGQLANKSSFHAYRIKSIITHRAI